MLLPYFYQLNNWGMPEDLPNATAQTEMMDVIKNILTYLVYPVILIIISRYFNHKDKLKQESMNIMIRNIQKINAKIKLNSKKRALQIKLEQIKSEAFKRAIFNCGGKSENWGEAAEAQYEKYKEIMMREFHFSDDPDYNEDSDLEGYIHSLEKEINKLDND